MICMRLPKSLLYVELVDSGLLVLVARQQYGRGEVGTVGRVGEALGFEAYGTAGGEGGSVSALETIQPVARIELHGHFGGIDLHGASAHGILAGGG